MDINEKLIPVSAKNFVRGSLLRSKYMNNNRQYLYNYRHVKADFLNNNNFVKDYYVDELVSDGKVSIITRNLYYKKLKEYLIETMEYSQITEEEMYSDILKLRAESLDYTPFTKHKFDLDPNILSCKVKHVEGMLTMNSLEGINQISIFNKKMFSYSKVYLIAEEQKYINIFTDIYLNLKILGINVSVIIKENPIDPESLTKDDFLANLSLEGYNEVGCNLLLDNEIGVDYSQLNIEKDAGLVCFGEWFLGANKNLTVDSYVLCTSEEIITREACSTNDKESMHFVFVPKEYNLIDQLETIEISLANYRLLSWLYDQLDEKVYDYTFTQLLEMYPDYFINYKSDILIDFISFDYRGDFYTDRIRSIVNYANKYTRDLRFKNRILKDSAGKDMRIVGVSVGLELQKKLKIQNFNQATNIREYYRRNSSNTDALESQIGIVSNFLFFSTDVSMGSYNSLREDRLMEQYDKFGWHLDYKYEQGMETVPAFNKAYFALNKTGKIEFGKKRLKDGFFTVNGSCFDVKKTIINPESELEVLKEDLIVYTPMYCKSEKDDFRNYKEPVGEGRTNLVFMNNEIICVREGNVLLPNAGVVLSFNKELAQKIFAGYKCSSQGYYETNGMVCTYTSNNVINKEWAYGGGMFLIENGVAVTDEEDIIQTFREEGWMNDLSKQTQGSLTYKNSKHPRTAIGKTMEGEFFIFVCTGRSKHSVGANYIDLVRIARELYGDVEFLMNIDGGASSFLGLTVGGEVIPLTDITYTDDSAAGEIRALNSIMYLKV